jgi:ribonuclease Z
MSDKLKLFYLGTSASSPTKTRNLTSLLINYRGKNYLFDAPENVQQQIMKIGESLQKIENIFITHLHGDHYYGLPGLLATMQLNNRENSINIFVPAFQRKNLLEFLKGAKINTKFEIKINELKTNAQIKLDDLTITGISLSHSTPTLGYIFKINDKIGKFNKEKAIKLKIPEGPLFRKLQEGKSIKIEKKIIKPKDVIDYSFKKIGKKIAYLTDTEPLKKPPKILQDSDILVHESTFGPEFAEQAKEKKHSEIIGVLSLAKRIKAKKVVIVHYSPRYKDKEELLKHIIKSKNTIIADDLSSEIIEDYN